MKRTQSTALLRLVGSSLRLSLAVGVVGFFVSASFAASTSKDTYYVNDHLASTVATSDAAGEIAQIESDAFGTQSGPAAKDSRFTGKPYDADMGAYVFPFRNYRSDEARWMSADPSGFPDGVNDVKYAPNPTEQFDFMGLIALDSATSTTGLLERLFLSEVTSPGYSSYSASDSALGMQYIHALVLNREGYSGSSSTFGYGSGASVSTVLTTRNAFPEFTLSGGIATLTTGAQNNINSILSAANTGAPGKYYTFVQNAITEANASENDPYSSLASISGQSVIGGIYGMFKASSSSGPGGRFVAIPGAVAGGNKFYTLLE